MYRVYQTVVIIYVFTFRVFLPPLHQLRLTFISIVRNLYVGSDTITSLLVPATAHHSTQSLYLLPLAQFQEL